MQDLISHIRQELSLKLRTLAKESFEDRGLSGVHIKSNPLLLQGIRFEPEDHLQVQTSINKDLSKLPLTVQLSDNSKLKVLGIDTVVTQKGLVYLADLLEADFV